jgi:hypothetical protein
MHVAAIVKRILIMLGLLYRILEYWLCLYPKLFWQCLDSNYGPFGMQVI